MHEVPSALAAALAERYRLIHEIGRGGMATVYLAFDPRHDRRVAIKVLRPEVAVALGRERFQQEIRIAAGLSHPHILPLHDSGELQDVLFYVMPYVEGESLRQRLHRLHRLPIEDALPIVREVVDALVYAHRHEVVHRDIKPENILLSGGHALVADFGIARALSAARSKTETEAGIVLGTPAYMSPEQVSGGKVDGRSDLFSLGCVLHEMLAGSLPFDGPPETMMSRRLIDPVPRIRATRPDVPVWLENVLLRALSKSPNDRFASATEMGAALAAPSAFETSGPTAVTPPPRSVASLAVLPLENLSHDPAEEYFADGMTDALITDLAKIRAIRVISRSSIMRYKGTHRSLPEIARELNVDAVIEGSVLRAGERVRITAQLVHAPSDTHLWAERYERRMSDVLDLQSELAQTIAGEIRVHVTAEERKNLARSRPIAPEAFEEYMKGRFQWGKRTDAGFEAAIVHFRRAIERDPGYALAYTGLADTSVLLAEYGNLSPVEAMPTARAAALKALEIDETLAEAHNSLAYVKHLHDWDWAGAERSFRRAIELNPNYAVAHHWFARNLLTQQRWDEAAAEIDAALRLDPLSLVLHSDYGYHAIATRKPQSAAERLRLTLEMDPHYPLAHFYLGLCHLILREFDAALGEFEKSRSMLGGALAMAAMSYAHASAGRVSEARALKAEMKTMETKRYVSPYLYTIVEVGLGDLDAAFEQLERAMAERHNWLVRIAWEPYLDPLRGDPRFDHFMKQVGFPTRAIAASA